MNQDAYTKSPDGRLKDMQSKYEEAFNFLQNRKKRQVNQLVLLNNLQRGDENIASTLLLTLFNRTMSNLYDDKLQVKFVPGEELDQKKVNSLNILAQNDYREMDKATLDYDWCWDTLFFGRGYMETYQFDTKRKLMKPQVINPLMFGYDPYFDNPQEWRYYWKWITKSYWDLMKLIESGKIKNIKNPKEIPSGIDPYLWDYKSKREEAKKVTPQAPDSYQGDVYQILEFFGYNDKGKKSVFWVDRNFSKILYEEELDLRDADDGKDSKWPIVVKEAFREPHASVVFSVADLLEDKHRARSVLLNLAFIAAKDKANPIYTYDPDKVQDVTQLFSRQINQHIPVKGPGDQAIAPLNKDSAMDPSLSVFMQILNQEANDPVGTGNTTKTKGGGKETATEAAIQQQLNDLAQSLQSKVMQFGEKEFWSNWVSRYKRYSKEGDIKLATIVGVKGMTWEKIDLASFQTKFPPGILIYSAKEAEYKELVLRRDLMEMYPSFQESFGMEGMRQFNKHVFLPKFLNDPQLIEILMPKTLDEIKANDENEAINRNSLPDVLDTDNHLEHLMIHAMAKPTWAKWTHIAWHEELQAQQVAMEKQMQQQQMMGGEMGGVAPQQGAQPAQATTQPQVGVAKKSPLQAASSLRNETMQNIGQKQMQQA